MQIDQRPAGAATMSPEMPNATRYYQWIVSKLAPNLGRRILDIGGGYGAHLEFIVRPDNFVTSLDLSEESVEGLRKRFSQFPHFTAMQADFGSQEVSKQLVDTHFDTITCLNVLEHIEDDVVALKDMHRLLADQEGTLLLQVPALEWLYGSLDREAGHFRRYSRSRLKRVLTEAGFTVIWLRYFNALGVLPWFVNARLLKRSVSSNVVDTQIKIFDRFLVPPMRALETAVSPPLGQSLLAAAAASRN